MDRAPSPALARAHLPPARRYALCGRTNGVRSQIFDPGGGRRAKVRFSPGLALVALTTAVAGAAPGATVVRIGAAAVGYSLYRMGRLNTNALPIRWTMLLRASSAPRAGDPGSKSSSRRCGPGPLVRAGSRAPLRAGVAATPMFPRQLIAPGSSGGRCCAD